jgi:hypothetical protein
VKLNGQPHRSHLEDKMIENNGNNMGTVEDMGVISQKNEKTQGKIFEKQ